MAKAQDERRLADLNRRAFDIVRIASGEAAEVYKKRERVGRPI
jgi:hypothetical protein